MRARATVVLIVLLVISVLLAGCGGLPPKDIANNIVGYYRTYKDAEGRACFLDPTTYDSFCGAVPDGILTVEPEYKTANGDVEVPLIIGGSTITLTFTKYQGKWMVKSFTKR